jgi:hypothetical protein
LENVAICWIHSKTFENHACFSASHVWLDWVINCTWRFTLSSLQNLSHPIETSHSFWTACWWMTKYTSTKLVQWIDRISITGPLKIPKTFISSHCTVWRSLCSGLSHILG